MKKILIIVCTTMFLAAGCNKNTPAANTATPSNNTTSSQMLPTPATETPAPPPATTAKTYSMTEVKQANSASKCWSVIADKVYDLTNWINQHPGGKARILQICGKDGTALFKSQHQSQSQPNNILTSFYIGDLK